MEGCIFFGCHCGGFVCTFCYSWPNQFIAKFELANRRCWWCLVGRRLFCFDLLGVNSTYTVFVLFVDPTLKFFWVCILLHICSFVVCVVDSLFSESVWVSFVYAYLDLLGVSVLLLFGLLLQSGVVRCFPPFKLSFALLYVSRIWLLVSFLLAISSLAFYIIGGEFVVGYEGTVVVDWNVCRLYFVVCVLLCQHGSDRLSSHRTLLSMLF